MPGETGDEGRVDLTDGKINRSQISPHITFYFMF